MDRITHLRIRNVSQPASGIYNLQDLRKMQDSTGAFLPCDTFLFADFFCILWMCAVVILQVLT